MNKIATYFKESYKELTGKSNLANLGSASAINHDCTGGNTVYHRYCMGNGFCSRWCFEIYL